MIKLREECGVVGIHGHPEAAKLAYLSLHALQHRGQEGAGIVSRHQGQMRAHCRLGLVGDIFGNDELDQLPGHTAIGHVRYSTAGGGSVRNVQPFVVRYGGGQVAIAHNGNLVNARRLRAQLESRGSIFGTSSDTEVILHLLATSVQGTFINRLVDALLQVQGAYSLVVLSEDKLVAVRDPNGFRPLVMGRLGDAVVFASETTALDLIGGVTEREVAPGEMIIVDSDGSITSLNPFPRRTRKACIFEHIYFARPNSTVFGAPVYDSRFAFGRALARTAPVDADVVIPVPDSGTPAALGYAQESAVPFLQGLIRSHYVGRTFIEPDQQIRDFGVRLKLSPVRSVIEGKRLVVVDDSIVRGTTSKKIVRLLRNAGAAEVHLRISSPPIVASCFYGVDTPTREELIAHRLTVEETRSYIGADSLAYLDRDVMLGCVGSPAETWCDACFSGDYPVPPEDTDQTFQLPLFEG